MFVITVPSADKKKAYTVRLVGNGVWVCDCRDHVYHSHGQKHCCKHIAGVAKSLAQFATVAKKSEKAMEILSV